jgi:hypothetical protein
MKRGRRTALMGLVAALLGLGLLAAACTSGASAGGSSDLSLKIVSPKNGAHVTVPFTLRLDPSVPLGNTDTGRNHVHVGFDGQSVDVERNLVFGDSCTVTNLAPGKHTIEASLRNADHSAAGADDTITVMVTGGASGTGSGSCGVTPSGGSSSGGGYGY